MIIPCLCILPTIFLWVFPTTPVALAIGAFVMLAASQSVAPRGLEQSLTTHLSSYPFIARSIHDVRVPHWITITFYDSYLLHQGQFLARLLSQAMIGLVLLMRRHEVQSPGPWPDLSDEALEGDMKQWAPAWIVGFTRREHFARFDLGNALRSFLNHAQMNILEREAPTHFTVPSGSRIPIDYLDGENPSLTKLRIGPGFGIGCRFGKPGHCAWRRR